MPSRTNLVIGIDPGKTGGYAAFRVVAEEPVAMLGVWFLPWFGKELAVATLFDHIRKLALDLGLVCRTQVSVGIEEAQPWAARRGDACPVCKQAKTVQGIASTAKYMREFGKILGAAEVWGCGRLRFSPQAWKKVVLAGTPKDKDAAIRWVRNKFPMAELTPGRCQKPQDGLADAVCIGWYAVLLSRGEA